MDPSTSLHNGPAGDTLLKALFDDSEIFVAVTGEGSGHIGLVNPAGGRMFGYANVEEMTGKSWTGLLKHPLTEEETASFRSAIEKNNHYSKEAEFITRDGRSFWGYYYLSSFRAEDRRLLVVKIRDIDGYKRVENNLRQEKQRFEALFKFATMGILMTNERGEIVLVNSFVLNEFGYTEPELIGKRVEELIPSRFHHNHTNYRDAYYHHPETRPMGAGRDLFALRKDGTEFPVEISLSPFQTSEGVFVIAFIIDISVRKEKEYADRQHQEEMARVNAEIKKLNDELEAKVTERTLQLEEAMTELKKSRDEIFNSLEKEKELNDMKSRFVSMASHEFRTPLSTILSSTSLLSKYSLTEDQPKRDKHIQRIKSSVNNLTGILNEFLSLGKIEDGKIEAHFTEFDLPELINSVCAEMEEIRKREQEIKYHHTGERQVRLDIELLRNILINLLSNAIKFSPDNGLIEVSSALEGNSRILIAVKDHGMGIAPEDQEHLFERFFRGKNVLNIQGTGLGLHIIGKYMELMQGEISFISRLNEGTEFRLSFSL